jgi:hypothetical protein
MFNIINDEVIDNIINFPGYEKGWNIEIVANLRKDVGVLKMQQISSVRTENRPQF